MIEADPATKWRNDVAMGVSPWNRSPHHAISPEGTTGQRDSATKWRYDVAMGVSPWNRNPHDAVSREGTTGISTQPAHVAPSGLRNRIRSSIHGFAPVATTCRPFGTNVLTPGHYVGSEEVPARERRACSGTRRAAARAFPCAATQASCCNRR